MSFGGKIANRLRDEHGVIFLGEEPTRAQYSAHGNLRDTFLVTERVLYAGRCQTSTQVPWQYRGLDVFGRNREWRGLEIALGTSSKKLACARAIDVFVTDNFSGYGQGLWVEVDEADAHVRAARDLNYLTERGYMYRNLVDKEVA